MSTVLVVDDEPRIQAILSRALQGQGHQVLLAQDRATAREHLHTRGIDVILLDLLLGTDHGLEVLDNIRRLRHPPPTIVVSAVTDVPTRISALHSGAIDVVAKPFNLAELMARVKRHCPGEGAPAPTPPRPEDLTVGVLHLEVRSRTATLGGEHVVLSERECAVLAYLMNHAGEVCTRADVFETVWGAGDEPDSNVVDVVVGRLRARVTGLVIETVRGVGYRLNRRDLAEA